VVYFRRCDPFSTFRFGTVPTFLRGLSPFSCFLLVAVTLFIIKHGQNSLKGNLGQATFWREEGFGLHGSRDESGEAWLAIAMGAAQKCHIRSWYIIEAAGTFPGKKLAIAQLQVLNTTYAVATIFFSSRFRELLFEDINSSFSILAPRRSILEARKLDFSLSSRGFELGIIRGLGVGARSFSGAVERVSLVPLHVANVRVLSKDSRCCFSGPTCSGFGSGSDCDSWCSTCGSICREFDDFGSYLYSDLFTICLSS